MDNRTGGWRRLVPGAAEQKAAATPEPEPVARVSEPGVTVIEPGVEMNGRLVVPHSLRIEGEFRGQIECAAAVLVSETGAVEAPIRARTIEIRGAVVGNLVASREVVLHPTGRLHGDVETPSLVVMRGATFNGGTRMYRPERGAQTSAPDRHSDVSAQPESQA
jgi:cytoskeletal protein CcmA (bactofilin family)